MLVATWGYLHPLLYLTVYLHSVAKEQKPEGMKRTSKWFGEEKLSKMYVSLGGK